MGKSNHRKAKMQNMPIEEKKGTVQEQREEKRRYAEASRRLTQVTRAVASEKIYPV